MAEFPRRHPWQTCVVVLGPIAVGANETLGAAGSVIAIAAAFTSVSILVSSGVRWLRHGDGPGLDASA